MAEKEELKERFSKFIDSISKNDIVAVLHHTDPDGVCSGVIISKLVERKRGKKIDLHINQRASEIPVMQKTIDSLKSAGVNKLIITDLNVDQAPESITEIEKFAEILIIDHHKIYNDLSSEKTIFIKPHFVSDRNPAAYPAAKLCFDLASEINEMDDLDWVAAIGVIGDCAFNSWKDFLDSVFSKYEIEKKQDFFETELGKTASLISNAECFDSSNAAESFDVVYSASSMNDVLGSSLQKYRDGVESEIKYWIEHMDEFAEVSDNLIFYLIKPKFHVRAPISTKLSLKHTDKTVIIVQDMGEEMLGISGRRRDEKIAVNDLLENATKNLEEANAGGHIPAAGGRIKREDLAKFKENLVNLLKNG